MNASSWALTDDLSLPVVVFLAIAAFATVVMLLVEVRRRERYGALIVLTGVMGVFLLVAAVARPVRVATRGSVVGPRVVVLVDSSRRLLLPADGSEIGAAGRTRRQVALDTVESLRAHFSDARLGVYGFGEGQPLPLPSDGTETSAELVTESDLVAALSHLSQSAAERPRAVVVVSDGRLSRPFDGADDVSLRQAVGALGVPIHTVRLVEDAPRDASVRGVRAAGAAVAHQELALTIEIGCSAGLDCGVVPVTVRELRHGVEPGVLAAGVAKVEDGVGKVELRITLDRAGARVVEVAIDAPEGDTIAENDSRTLTFSVARERVRILHIAGRPTYDVRELRRWLKSDESIDLVAFFILRTETDNPRVRSDDELALIPFPVDELFEEHLPSFDAVLLQDIDAVQYKLDPHLPRVARYVEAGGGLIMVGGPTAFGGGRYGGTALGRVVPVAIPDDPPAADTLEFVPEYTEAGRATPVLKALLSLFDGALPKMAGSNTLGPPRPGALVLWEHPNRRTRDGSKMPVLALGEAGDGRTIALGVDGTHQLGFSEFASRAAGRGYGALWDGLVGWLMRDPRYEAARIEVVGECIAGSPTRLRLTRLPGAKGDVELELDRLGKTSAPIVKKLTPPESGPVEIDVGALEAGGYTARARVGASPPTRQDFACERGGEAWSDSRPDANRLVRIAAVTGGVSVDQDDVAALPSPEPTTVAAERHVSPVLPPWAWSAMAALALGAHWVARRRGGLV